MKYPRMYHLPFSPGATNDDKILSSSDQLLNIPLIVTEKLDGSNVSFSKDGCFSRGHSGPPTHSSFDAFKALHANLKYSIPNNIFFYGEWCFAKHSIFYDKLSAYFFLFAIKDLETKSWLSWNGIQTWAERLGLETVPIIKEDITFKDINELESFINSEARKPSAFGPSREGFVLRSKRGFSDNEFPQMIAKWVRKDHVTTDKHWKFQEIVRNQLRPLA